MVDTAHAAPYINLGIQWGTAIAKSSDSLTQPGYAILPCFVSWKCPRKAFDVENPDAKMTK